MRIFNKIWLLFLLCFLCRLSKAQSLDWMLGTWNGTASSVNNAQSVRTIIIDSVGGENFAGTRVSELKGSVHAKIITSLSGYIDKKNVYIKTGNVLYKKAPPRVELTDCSSCIPGATISIQSDRIVVTSIISGCQAACNGTAVYYKLLCDFDTLTQRDLVNRFGTAADITSFKPCIKKTPEMIAGEKRKEQAIADSLNLVKLNEAQRLKDSATNAAALAKQREKEIADSISLVRKREKQILDSTNAANKIAQQKEEQRLKEAAIAAAAVAKTRKKEIADSISLAKKLEKQIQDSTNAANKIAQQKEQQRIKDSISNAAALAAAPLAVKDKDTAKASTAKAFETRENIVLETYHIPTPDILIELFDNAQIDGDRVSVYHNNTLIVNNKMLTKEPITMKIHADAANRMHEFVMIAENLGSIAPNTALMRVTAGNKTYKLSVKTDLQTNAKIVFYYDGN